MKFLIPTPGMGPEYVEKNLVATASGPTKGVQQITIGWGCIKNSIWVVGKRIWLAPLARLKDQINRTLSPALENSLGCSWTWKRILQPQGLCPWLGLLPPCSSVQPPWLGSKRGPQTFQLSQLSPDLRARGSADVLFFGRSLAKNSIPWGEGVQVELPGMLLFLVCVNVLLARQLLGLGKMLRACCLTGRVLGSRMLLLS